MVGGPRGRDDERCLCPDVEGPVEGASVGGP